MTLKRLLNYSQIIFLSFVVLMFAYIATTTTLGISMSYDPVQFMDQWDCIDSYHNYKEAGILGKWIFAKHNEHRIALTRIESLLDYRLGLSNIVLLSILFIGQVVHLFLLWILARGVLRANHLASLAIFSLIGSFLFSSSQMENFTWGFQVQFIQVFLFATASFILMEQSGKFAETKHRARSSWFFAASILTCLLAVFSMVNGLIAMAVLCVHTLLLKTSWRKRTVAFAVFVLTSFLYLRSSDSSVSAVANLSFDSNTLSHLLKFTTIYLSLPVSKFSSNLSHAVVVSTIALSLMFLGSIGHFILREKLSATYKTLLAILLFCVLSAMATAVGRQHLSLLQATADRYSTSSMIFWPTLLVYLFGIVGSVDNRSVRWVVKSTAYSVGFVSLVFLASIQMNYPHFFENLVFKKQIARLSIRAGLIDDPFLKSIHPDYPRLLRTFNRLKNNPRLQRIYGSTIGEQRIQIPISQKVPSSMPVFFTELPAFDGKASGYSCVGTIDTLSLNLRDPVEILNQSGEVLGEGVVAPSFVIPCNLPGVDEEPSAKAWYGYLKGPISKQNRLFLYNKSHQFLSEIEPVFLEYYYGKTVELPNELSGLGVEIIKETTDWILDGKHPVAPRIEYPLLTYGSWIDSDANTGNLRMKIQIESPIKRLYIPYLTGPASPDAKITLRTQQGKLLTPEIDCPANPQRWKALEVSFEDELTDDIVLEVVETGSKWGQWTAIAQPCVMVD